LTNSSAQSLISVETKAENQRIELHPVSAAGPMLYLLAEAELSFVNDQLLFPLSSSLRQFCVGHYCSVRFCIILLKMLTFHYQESRSQHR